MECTECEGKGILEEVVFDDVITTICECSIPDDDEYDNAKQEGNL